MEISGRNHDSVSQSASRHHHTLNLHNGQHTRLLLLFGRCRPVQFLLSILFVMGGEEPLPHKEDSTSTYDCLSLKQNKLTKPPFSGYPGQPCGPSSAGAAASLFSSIVPRHRKATAAARKSLTRSHSHLISSYPPTQDLRPLRVVCQLSSSDRLRPRFSVPWWRWVGAQHPSLHPLFFFFFVVLPPRPDDCTDARAWTSCWRWAWAG